MDEDMEDFILEPSSPVRIDLDYEFDAAHFFDFTLSESVFEAREAERWFEFASSYPPSPLIVKLNWSTFNPVIEVTGYPDYASSNSDVEIDAGISQLKAKAKRQNFHHHVGQDTPKVKSKSVYKPFNPRSSTLLKPTASQLAKESKARDFQSDKHCGRHKCCTRDGDRSLQKTSGSENVATKRQKLESGYLRKEAHLKHPTPLLHKTSEKLGQNNDNLQHLRTKLTIPKEPELETAQRAQRRRFRSKNKSGETTEPSVHTFKARPLNRKILEAPSLPLLKKSTPQLPEFHLFHLKTMQRAMQHSANLHTPQSSAYVVHRDRVNSKRLNSEEEKCETGRNFKASSTSKKIFPFKADGGLFTHNGEEGMEGTILKELLFKKNTLHNPPIDMFSKLSIKSEAKNNGKYRSKHHLSTNGLKGELTKSYTA